MTASFSNLLIGYVAVALLFGGSYLTWTGISVQKLQTEDSGSTASLPRRFWSDVVSEAALVGFGWGLWFLLAILVVCLVVMYLTGFLVVRAGRLLVPARR